MGKFKPRRVIEPVTMTEQEKLEWIAQAGPWDVVPTAFKNDNQITLIAMLCRRVLALEADNRMLLDALVAEGILVDLR